MFIINNNKYNLKFKPHIKDIKIIRFKFDSLH